MEGSIKNHDISPKIGSMETLLEILKIILPSLVVFGAVYLVLQRFFEREQKQAWMKVKEKNQKEVLPLRLQAYERLTLLLERISLNALIMRVHKSNMSARDLREELLRSIRQEFDHNLSQQIYVSDEAWDLIRRSKEEMVKFINTEAEKLNDNASGVDLSKALLDRASQVERMPTRVAADYLKKEARQYF